MFEIFVNENFDFVIPGQFRREFSAREDDDGGDVGMVDTLSQYFTANKTCSASDNDLHLVFWRCGRLGALLSLHVGTRQLSKSNRIGVRYFRFAI